MSESEFYEWLFGLEKPSRLSRNGPKEWYDSFRVFKETFDYIVSEIENEITQKDTRMRKATPSRKGVAIALYFLGSTAEYRTIANLFGVSLSFVCLCIKDVSKAITRKLKTGSH